MYIIYSISNYKVIKNLFINWQLIITLFLNIKNVS